MTFQQVYASWKVLKNRRNKQERFLYKSQFPLDIVPFGGIAHDDNYIYWPPEVSQAMSVAGYIDVAKHTLEITVDNSFTI